jgi:CheY-like chemotaxis protein
MKLEGPAAGEVFFDKTGEGAFMNIPANKVLLIDDDEIQNEMLKGALEMYSMVVAAESSPFNALKTAGNFKPNVIICDIVMPGKTGSRVVRDLQEHPATRHIPIIFLSALVTRREEAASSATHTMMAKPVNTSRLLDHIRRLTRPPEKAEGGAVFAASALAAR